MMPKEEKKTVKMDFTNKCGRMKLNLTSKDAVDLSMRIAQVFDEACDENKKHQEGSQ